MRLNRLSKVKQLINDGAEILTWVHLFAKPTLFSYQHAAWRTGSITLPYTGQSCTVPKILQGSTGTVKTKAQMSEPYF